GNLEFLVIIQPRYGKLDAKRSLRNAYRNRAVQIRPTPLEEQMLFDFKHHIKVAVETPIQSRLALTGNTKTRPHIHAKRNAQFDGFLALHAPLPTAFGAALLDDLSRALTNRAIAADLKKTLLIVELATATTVWTANDADSLL